MWCLASILLLLGFGTATAQDPLQSVASTAQPKVVTSIYDVHEGMPRDAVLTGLAKGYRLSKEPALNDMPATFETWLVQSKDSSDRMAEVSFFEGKTAAVHLRLFWSTASDAIRLAEELQVAAHNISDPPRDPDVLQKVTNVRNGVAKIQTQDFHTVDFDERRLFLTMGERTFRITITKIEGQPGTIRLDELRK